MLHKPTQKESAKKEKEKQMRAFTQAALNIRQHKKKQPVKKNTF